MTTYTGESKQILRDDIQHIDDQLDLARRHMAEGNKAEAWSTLDGLLNYYDFKKHFPDILVGEGEYMRFMDMYEALRAIDDIIEIDATQMLVEQSSLEWRPGYTREEILRRLEAFLNQIEAWLELRWFEGEEILDSLQVLKEKVQAFIRFFQNYSDQPLWPPVIDVRDAKKRLLRSLSDELPFTEIYELLMTMDRNLTHLVFQFRLHLDEVTLETVERVINEIAEKKHAILAIIDATLAEDENVPVQPPENEGAPTQPPPGWDDLQPFPPAGYAMFGTSIVPIQISRRQHSAGRDVGIDIGRARNSRTIIVSGLIGFAIGAMAASTLVTLLFVDNCPVG